MADYSWVDFFKKVSEWLKDYENRQPELIQILRKIGVDNGLDDKLDDDRRVPLTVIDPFTFFALFMKYGINKRKQLFAELVKELQWEVEVPTGFDGVPSAQAVNVWLFPSATEQRSDDMISALWELFHQAISGQIDGALFDRVLKIRQTGFTKLTQYLLYVAPDNFFPVDAQTKPWLKLNGRELPEKNWASYSSLLAWLKTYTDQPFYELSYQAWYENQIEKQTQQPSKSTVSQGNQPKKNSESKNNLALNQILYGPPGTGKTYITRKMAVELADPHWMEQFLGQDSSSADPNARINQIKQRYEELVEDKRIAFITFHQSFSYEDFIEGIRAETDEETGQINYRIEDGVFKTLALLADAQHSSVAINESLSLDGRRIWKMSLGNTLKRETEAYDDCIEQGYIGLGWGGSIDFSHCDDRATVQKRYSKHTGESYDRTSYNVTAVNTFKNIIVKGDIVIVSDGNHKFRAIAEVTGEYEYSSDAKERYFNQCRPVRWLRVFDPSLPKELLFKKSLSQMTLYELKPSVIKRDKLEGFLNFNKKSSESPENYVLIIDEINRGNISRVFGELITLLETSKRKGGTDERSVVLPYSKTSFSVPNNLYVLGTMNTADKSLAQLDLALRRRFEFIEMMPQPDTLVDISVYGVSISELLDVLNQRIEVLLDRDHMLGHTYFWPLKDAGSDAKREKVMASIFEKRIIPLLQEYFFADWERIAWVLNDSHKPDSARFIQLDKVGHSLERLFPESIAHQVMDRRYRINKEAFTNPDSYRGILPERGE